MSIPPSFIDIFLLGTLTKLSYSIYDECGVSFNHQFIEPFLSCDQKTMFYYIEFYFIVASQAIIRSIYLNHPTLWVSEDTSKAHGSWLTFVCPIKVELKKAIKRAEELRGGFSGRHL